MAGRKAELEAELAKRDAEIASLQATVKSLSRENSPRGGGAKPFSSFPSGIPQLYNTPNRASLLAHELINGTRMFLAGEKAHLPSELFHYKDLTPDEKRHASARAVREDEGLPNLLCGDFVLS